MRNSGAAFQSIRDISQRLRNREITSESLTQLMLERINILNPHLHCFNFVATENALMTARKADKEIADGQYRGALHGIPVAIKDLLFTQSMPTTMSSPLYDGWMAEFDATVVSKLEKAGAIILGKLNMTEFALSGYHPDKPYCRNPWNENHWAGVSSSGSGSATAAALCFGAIGSDTGGSIRFPSAANGVVGLKPTYGRISRHGTFPLSQSLDTVGPMARSVADVAILLEAIAGYDASDPTTLCTSSPQFTKSLDKDIKGLKIGVDKNYITSYSDPRVANAVEQSIKVLQSLGAEICPVDVSDITDACNYWSTITGAEANLNHSDTFPCKSNHYGPVFKHLLEQARAMTGKDIANAYIQADRIKGLVHQILSSVDVLACPSMPLLPPSIDELPPQHIAPAEQAEHLLCYTAPFNFSGNPTLSIPCGISDEGLPYSLQLVGKLEDEATLIQIGDAYERAAPWQQHYVHMDINY